MSANEPPDSDDRRSTWIYRHLQSADSRIVAYIVTTSMAAVFNLGVLLTICFWVMPSINRSIKGDRDNAERILSNHELLMKNTDILIEHKKILLSSGPELRIARDEINRLNTEIQELKVEIVRLRDLLSKTKKGG